jgi:hypothetical protein
MADGDVIAAIIQDTGEVIEIDQPCIPKRLTQTGLLLPANLPFEKWQSVLQTLRGMEFSVMWWLGDCLRYGERAYGEKYAQALDATDYAYQTIADAKWVAGRFELSRRRENLTWSHHREVAGIEDDAEQDAVLDAAATGGWSKKRLRSEVRCRNAARRGSVNGPRTASANTEPLRGSPLPLPAPGAALPVEPPDLDRVAIARAALGALDFDQRLALFLEHPGEVYVARMYLIARRGGKG